MKISTGPLGVFVAAVREINRKYAEPQIEMTPLVKVCLVALRVYLVVLVGLLVYKFVVTARQ